VCDTYVPREQILRGGVCSPACLDALVANAREKRHARAASTTRRKEYRRAYRSEGLPVPLRRRIRRRDGDRCRYCGITQGLHVHHIEYRSEGGSNDDSNLITLCNEHHALMHTNKGRYQPLCRAYIWMLYVEGQSLTLLQLERRLRHERVA
jgi:5-methylcytosine-specific restriction endonuclease McrA